MRAGRQPDGANLKPSLHVMHVYTYFRQVCVYNPLLVGLNLKDRNARLLSWHVALKAYTLLTTCLTHTPLASQRTHKLNTNDASMHTNDTQKRQAHKAVVSSENVLQRPAKDAKEPRAGCLRPCVKLAQAHMDMETQVSHT